MAYVTHKHIESVTIDKAIEIFRDFFHKKKTKDKNRLLLSQGKMDYSREHDCHVFLENRI